MRKSILACTVSLLMSPVATWALGMGDVQVNSSLNQPLHAEIDIHSVTKKNIESLQLSIASKEAFAKAGIHRSHFLTKFKFDIKQKNGKTIASITTTQPFKEPYIEFLIEANWNSGRLIREYTILVDPPEFLHRQSLPVRDAEVDSSSQIKRGRTTTDSSKGTLTYGPTIRNDTLWVIANSMTPDDVSVNQMMLALLRDNPEAFFKNNINNLKAGYVLRIDNQKNLYLMDKRSARREVRQQYQSWKELRSQQSGNTNLVDRSERNETVDTGGELRLLASGKSDDADKINKEISTDEQAKEIREKLALSIEAIDSATSENLELRERIRELEAILESKSSLMELKDESLSALQKQIELRNLEASEGDEVTAENETIDELEEKVSEAETIVEEVTADTLINDEFAGHIDASVELAKDEMLARQAVEAPIVEKEVIENELDNADTAETITTEKSITTEETAETEEAIVSKETIVAKATDIVTAETVKVSSQKEAIQKPAPVKAPEKPLIPIYEQIATMLLGDYLPYTAGSLGFFVLLLIALKMRGTKKEEDFEEGFEETLAEQPDETFDADNILEKIEASENIVKPVENESETSFLSDFSASNAETLMPDDTEADPLAEADVFIVYGRYLQAEESLKEVIIKEPQRIDFQMKLLEVYSGDNQKEAFSRQAEVVKDIIKEEDGGINESSDWATIVSWAKSLDISLSDESNDIDIDFDTTELDTTEFDDIKADNIEFDTTELDDIEVSMEFDNTEVDDTEINSVEFDSSAFDDSEVDNAVNDKIDSIEEDSIEEESNAESSLDDSVDSFEQLSATDSDELSLDDNLEQDDFTADTDVSINGIESTELDLEEDITKDSYVEPADFTVNEADLIDLEDENSSDEKDDKGPTEDDFALELDALDLETTDEQDADDSTIEADIEDMDLSLADDMDLDLSDLEALDDETEEANAVDNKLDLARAYIDMEDVDSATSLLDEVINEGDEGQIVQAKILQQQATSK